VFLGGCISSGKFAAKKKVRGAALAFEALKSTFEAEIKPQPWSEFPQN
jgi:hypothetical protein